VRSQYAYGFEDPSLIDPDNWALDGGLIDRPGVDEITPECSTTSATTFLPSRPCGASLGSADPPTPVASGANDEIFPQQLVQQIPTDHPGCRTPAVPTGHFALEEAADQIAALIRYFLVRTVPPA
jgi:hypothetical protein